jgi:hypothetical protein
VTRLIKHLGAQKSGGGTMDEGLLDRPGPLLAIGSLLIAGVIGVWFWVGILPPKPGDTGAIRQSHQLGAGEHHRQCSAP